MKRAIVLFITIFSVLHTTDAQWQYRSCDVTDIKSFTNEEFQCLWDKASRGVRRNAIITSAGVVFAGTTAIYGSLAFAWGGAYYSTAFFISVGGAFVGLFWGTPNLIAWAVRKHHLKENLHYKAFDNLSLNLSPLINRNFHNNSYSIGLKASLSF